MKSISRRYVAGVFAMALTFGALSAAAPAAADESAGEVGLYVMQDGALVPLSDEFLEESVLAIDPPVEPGAGTVSPQLIDWNQWYGCFMLNNEEDIFREYTFYWNGLAHDVNLKCGNDYWGYRHIIKKEDDWEAKWNQAVAAGWNPAADGLGSWDDLMAVGAGVAITWPEYVGGNPVSNTTCAVSDVYFVDSSTGLPVYTFRARAAWSNNNDRLLTAFPQSSATC